MTWARVACRLAGGPDRRRGDAIGCVLGTWHDSASAFSVVKVGVGPAPTGYKSTAAGREGAGASDAGTAYTGRLGPFGAAACAV